MGALVEAAAAVTASANGVSPPQNLEAEEHVLGALLLANSNPDVIPDVLSTGLSGADFYRETNATIFKATLALHEKGEPVEALTIVDELERRGDLDSVGGKVRIHELAALVPASRNAPHYAKLVLRQSQLRAIVDAGAELQRLGAEAGNVEALTERATEIAASLARPSTAALLEPLDLGELLTGPIPQTEWLWNGWIACGDLVIWAGDPGVGKSIGALCLADATRRGASLLDEPCKRGRAGVFDFENPLDEANKRLRRVGVTAEEHDGLTYFHAPALNLSTEAGRRELAETIERYEFDLVVIDSLRRAAPGLDENDSGAVSAVLSPLRALTARSGRTIVVVHHSRKRLGDNPTDASQMVRGSLDLVASVDVLLYVRAKEAGTFTLEQGKSRRGLAHESILVQIEGSGDDETLSLSSAGPVASAEDKVEAMLARIIEVLRADGGVLARQVIGMRVGVDVKNGTFSRALKLGYDRNQLAKPEREKTTDPQMYALAEGMRA
jgi:hypothetical protein